VNDKPLKVGVAQPRDDRDRGDRGYDRRERYVRTYIGGRD
jgi:hypothetical protein